MSKDQILGLVVLIFSILILLLSLDGNRIGKEKGSIKLFLTALMGFGSGIYLLFFK